MTRSPILHQAVLMPALRQRCPRGPVLALWHTGGYYRKLLEDNTLQHRSEPALLQRAVDRAARAGRRCGPIDPAWSVRASPRDRVNEGRRGKPRRSGKRRILVFGATAPAVGGIATFIEHAVNSRLREEFEFSLFDPSQHAPVGGTPLSRVAFKTVALFRYVLAVKKRDPEIVHMHTPGYTGFWITAVFLMATAMLSRKIVIHVHRGDFATFYDETSWIGKKVIAGVLRRCACVVILSEQWRPFFETLVPASGIEVIPNGVPVEPFDGVSPAGGGPQDSCAPSVLFMGSLCRAKGVHDLLDAIRIVRRKRTDVVFVLAGEPETEADRIELQELTKKGIAEGHIALLGNISGQTKLDRLRASDIFVLPSHAEGLPYVVLEAMAAGLPIVASAVGAIPDVVTDSQNGFLIQSGDHLGLADRILRLLDDSSLRREMGAKNQRKAAEQYSLDTTIGRLEAIYAGL